MTSHCVGGAAFLGGRLGGDPADGQAHRFQQRAHPLGVAAGQVVVDRDDVDVPAAERVAGGGDRAGQRLALTGGHLDDVAGQHPQRTEQLDVERTQAGRPLGRLPGDRQELRDVGGFGEVVEVEQLRGLAQLLVVEVGGLLVEFGRGAAPRPSTGSGSSRCWRRAASRSGCSACAGLSVLGVVATVQRYAARSPIRASLRGRACVSARNRRRVSCALHGVRGQARLDRRG